MVVEQRGREAGNEGHGTGGGAGGAGLPARLGPQREPRLAAWAAFLRAHAAVKANLERELLAERNLPLTWYEVLLHVDGYGGELRMQELARSVLLSKSGLTRLVDRMEAAGLVLRRTCESDRRGAFVGITPKGAAALRAAAPVHLRGITEHFATHLSDEELRVIRVAMERIATAAEGGAAPQMPPCDPNSGGEAD
jgi:DNA-binding MarR family transcriptional regulator